MKTCCRLALLPVLWIAFATGCATVTPTVNTWRNPAFSPTPTNTITLKINVNAPAWDVATGKILADELHREGFKLAPEGQSDYLLSYVVSGNLVEHDYIVRSAATPPPQPTQTMGQASAQPGMAYSYAGVEKSYSFPTRDIRLFLYSNPKTNPAGLQLAWQGTITLVNKTSPESEPVLFKTLLHYFGGDKNGPVDLKP